MWYVNVYKEHEFLSGNAMPSVIVRAVFDIPLPYSVAATSTGQCQLQQGCYWNGYSKLRLDTL